MKIGKVALRLAVWTLAILFSASIFAQSPPPPPSYAPAQLDQLVARIALYPDPLLAQVLAGATYPDQIPDAARWADEHHYLTGQALADAIQADQLPWDPSVQALLPFPSVLATMASDMNWTADLGNAFLAQQQDVMDAVQRERQKARNFGYLRSNSQIVVGGGPYITIMPVNPGYVVVPYYNPSVVFFAPRPGFFVGGGIRFGYGITIGAFFRPWGSGAGRFDWGRRAVIIDNAPWRRTWVNRSTYAHPYPGVRHFSPAQRVPERHELESRSVHERQAAREGQRRVEDHHGQDSHRGRDRGNRQDHK
ncbi:MAG: DUF3300 domain-containing protein [Candidatus Acidiferrales bacterium]